MTWTKGLTNEDGSAQVTGGATAWDYVVFGGVVCPGVARVNAKAPSGLDLQKPKGQKKTFTVDNGDPPVEFDIEVILQPEELREFRDFIIPVLRPKSKTGGRRPLSFEHPMAQFWNVSAITVDDIDTPMPKSGGVMRVKIKAYEWAAAPTKVKKSQAQQNVQRGPDRVGQDRFSGGLYYTISSIPNAVDQFDG